MFTLFTKLEKVSEFVMSIIKAEKDNIIKSLGLPEDLNIAYLVKEDVVKNKMGSMQVTYHKAMSGQITLKEYEITVFPKGMLNNLLVLTKAQLKALVIETLVHELTHVRQDQSKSSAMDYIIDFEQMLPYETRPKEIEARTVASKYNRDNGSTTYDKEMFVRQVSIGLLAYGTMAGLGLFIRSKRNKNMIK